MEKRLSEQDLDLLNKSIIELVEKKTGAKIRS
jgi:phenylalanyl-tRNA synthetase beta chain